MKEKIKTLGKSFLALSAIRKIELIVAMVCTVLLIISIPVLAWFSNQRKIAELQKIKYPNSLYINAAYREDQAYFGLDTIDINDYKLTESGGYVTDENGNAVRITEKQYVFSVSGTNTEYFILQLAHTNNNLFSYKIYNATQYDEAHYSELTPAQKANCVKFVTTNDSHTENPLQVEGDEIVENAGNRYYLKGTEVDGVYKNHRSADSKLAIKNVNNPYYRETYGSYTNVEDHAVPAYWQKIDIPTSDDPDVRSNKKPFCRYYILEVTWIDSEQAGNETKESDMVFLAVERSDGSTIE